MLAEVKEVRYDITVGMVSCKSDCILDKTGETGDAVRGTVPGPGEAMEEEIGEEISGLKMGGMLVSSPVPEGGAMAMATTIGKILSGSSSTSFSGSCRETSSSPSILQKIALIQSPLFSLISRLHTSSTMVARGIR